MGNSMENMHTDFRLERVKSLSAPHCFLYVFYESILSASGVFNMHDVLLCKTSFDVILLQISVIFSAFFPFSCCHTGNSEK